MTDLSSEERLTINRILKVNHAGEVGAIRIYQAQILVSKLFYPDLVPKLKELLLHEKEHRRIFYAEIRGRKTHPCYASFLWSLGGFLLGLTTALLGRSMVMVCTEAVEETVHRHLDDQLKFLQSRDSNLRQVISDIQAQELEHLEFARENIKEKGFPSKTVERAVCISTEIVIFLSTWGASLRMRQRIKAEPSHPIAIPDQVREGRETS